jgi:Ca-activated chloride channel homolog
MISFEQPFYLLGILASLAAAFVLHKLVKKQEASRSILIANFNLVQESSVNKLNLWPKLLPALQLAGLCCLWLALSNPVIFSNRLVKAAQVILAIDISKSMTAEDLEPNRLEGAKAAALEFITELPKGIEIGIEFFDKNAVMALPLTKDKKLAEQAIASLSLNSLGSGTAIGEAILLANKSFGQTGEKHLILLTDGESNAGIDSNEALASINKITIHTVGIGSTVGVAVNGGLLTQLNREELEQIAASTGGHYYEAGEDKDKLNEIYRSFAKNYRSEKVKQSFSGVFVLFGLILSAAAFALDWLKFKG